MTTFHRYVSPTYSGGLPSGYDLINVVSGSTGGDGGAFADGAKSGGPNNGTYFVAFSENAQSQNANRGMRALAQNCDALDDYLHRDVAIAVRTTDVTAGSPVASIVLPTDTYLGSSAYTTSTADLARLFSVVDNNDEDILDSGGNPVVVASVTLGSGDQIGGGGANGSFSGNTVQVNLAPSVPTGTTYRVYYGSRSNLATLPNDAFTTIKVRNAEEVSSPVEANFVALRGDGDAWNAPWETTIDALVHNGLHQRYMRSSVVADIPGDIPPTAETYWPGIAADSPGNGAYIIRRGPALTLYALDEPYADPLNALFAGKCFDDTPGGGTVGFAYYGSRRAGVLWGGEFGTHIPSAGGFAHLWPHYFDNSLSTTQPVSRIVNGTAALFSLVGAFNADSGEAIVQLTAANNYFRSGGFSSVNLGYDLLECTHPVGANTVTRTYVIVGHGSSATPTDATKVRVRNLDGTVPNFTAPVTGTVKWISTTMWVGDGAAEYHGQAHSDVKPSLLSGFFYQTPLLLSVGGAQDDISRIPASFSASRIDGGTPALRWGAFNEVDSVSSVVFSGQLNGDGSGTFTTVTTNNLITTTQVIGATPQNTTGTVTWDPTLGSWASMTASVDNQTITINLTNTSPSGAYVLFLDYSVAGSGTNVILSWSGPLRHVFSPGDDQPLAGTGQSKWVGHRLGGFVFWTVTHY